jgi:hypothetical protein|tara:strand:+ start:820 stop:1125 length:306 start_codon:yes stop_codon:yes gene_type:complete
MPRYPNAVAVDSYNSTKAVGETLPYNINWSDMLASAETISTSNWTVSNSEMTLSDSQISGTQTTIKASAGKNGYNYVLTNTIVTSDGNTAVRNYNILVEPK